MAAKQKQIAIISSGFWADIVTNLENDCIKVLQAGGIKVKQIEKYRVPGSFEIPLLAKKLAKKKKYSAIIAFGAIHKGQTYHFELVANECARGCMQVGLDYEIPVIFEVMAVYDIKHAIDRSTSGNKDNRGVDAANATLEMLKVLSKI